MSITILVWWQHTNTLPHVHCVMIGSKDGPKTYSSKPPRKHKKQKPRVVNHIWKLLFSNQWLSCFSVFNIPYWKCPQIWQVNLWSTVDHCKVAPWNNLSHNISITLLDVYKRQYQTTRYRLASIAGLKQRHLLLITIYIYIFYNDSVTNTNI